MKLNSKPQRFRQMLLIHTGLTLLSKILTEVEVGDRNTVCYHRICKRVLFKTTGTPQSIVILSKWSVKY